MLLQFVEGYSKTQSKLLGNTKRVNLNQLLQNVFTKMGENILARRDNSLTKDIKSRIQAGKIQDLSPKQNQQIGGEVGCKCKGCRGCPRCFPHFHVRSLGWCNTGCYAEIKGEVSGWQDEKIS